ncbi:MAG: hypothetical protein WC952_06415 [Desulfobulbaceae bacterium]|jgi:UDP-2,3-diacylglucosamine pyrophosphatase LpxH
MVYHYLKNDRIKLVRGHSKGDQSAGSTRPFRAAVEKSASTFPINNPVGHKPDKPGPSGKDCFDRLVMQKTGEKMNKNDMVPEPKPQAANPSLTRRSFLKTQAGFALFMAAGGMSLLSGTGDAGQVNTSVPFFGTTEKFGAGREKPAEENPFAVCISDLHIGERYGGITGDPGKPADYQRLDPSDSESPYVRTRFIEFLNYCKELRRQNGKIENLVILGDMWDLAMNNQEDSFRLSAKLFQHLKKHDQGLALGELFENVIYVPGNHDHHFWSMLQERYWITDRLERGLDPLQMPRAVSLTLDIDTGEIISDDNRTGEAGIPQHNMISSLLGIGSETPVHVAYPHFFIRGKDGRHMILTHGHLFEQNWNMVTTIFNDLLKQQDIPLTIRNIEMLNAITTEWHSYSLAQTPPYKFWEMIYDHHFDHKAPTDWEKTFFEVLQEHLKLNDKRVDLKTPSAKFHSIEGLQLNRELVEHYLAQAKKEYLHADDRITSIIYGHTHIPCFNEIFMRHNDERRNPMWVHNTGGWVDIVPEKFHMPAPMLVYRDGTVSALRLRDVPVLAASPENHPAG